MFAKSIATKGGDVFRDEFSVAFDGTNDYVETSFIPDYISTNATTAFWIKMNDFSGTQQIGIHNNKRWYHGFDGSNLFIGVANAHNSSSPVTPSPALVAGQWFHYCVTAIGGTATIYINGVAQGTLSYTQSSATDPDTGYMIGARDNSGAGNYMNGNISEVVHYNVGLTANQVKTIYNGREPYNHKEGIATSNLISWWRMGDGSWDKYQLIADSSTATLFGTDLIVNGTFDSNTTGWSNYSSGTVSHETTITHNGAGALKCTFDGTNHWAGMQTSELPSIQSNTLYLIEAYIYIPSGFDGGNCWLTDGATFGGATTEESLKASSSITDEWQLTRTMFRTASDDTGKLYIRAHTDPSDTKYIFVDNVTMRPVTGGKPGHTYNMTEWDFVGDTP